MGVNDLFFLADLESQDADDITACKRLVAAKMGLHVQDFNNGMRGRCRNRDDFEYAKRWFISNDDRPFTFVWSCEILGLDPARIRTTSANKWRQEKLHYRMGSAAQGEGAVPNKFVVEEAVCA
jgi:hypothetical protein